MDHAGYTAAVPRAATGRQITVRAFLQDDPEEGVRRHHRHRATHACTGGHGDASRDLSRTTRGSDDQRRGTRHRRWRRIYCWHPSIGDKDMGKSSAVVEVSAPTDKCYGFVKESVANPKYLKVYQGLHPGKDYSGRIIDDIENCRIAIEESGIDSVTKIRLKGWTIKYDFEEIDGSSTKVTISVEYGALLAIGGLTTAKGQSINEILARVTALLALEYK